MTRDHVLYLFFALFLAGCGIAVALRATEPPGARGLAPGELQSTEARELQIRDTAISRCVEKESRLKADLRTGDFDACLQIARTRRLMLMLEADRDGTDKAEIGADPELQRILRQCRRWAKFVSQENLAQSLSRSKL